MFNHADYKFLNIQTHTQIPRKYSNQSNYLVIFKHFPYDKLWARVVLCCCIVNMKIDFSLVCLRFFTKFLHNFNQIDLNCDGYAFNTLHYCKNWKINVNKSGTNWRWIQGKNKPSIESFRFFSQKKIEEKLCRERTKKNCQKRNTLRQLQNML